MQPFLHLHKLMLSYYGCNSTLRSLVSLICAISIPLISSYSDIIRSYVATKQGFRKRNNGLGIIRWSGYRKDYAD